MNTFTIYFDVKDPRRSKWFAVLIILVVGNGIYQGLHTLSHADKAIDWISSAILLLGCVVLIATFAAIFYCQKKFGRPRVVFSDEGIAVKAKRRGQAEELAWDDIRTIHIKHNGAEIVPKTETARPIKIPLGSYMQFQQIQKNLEKYAARHYIELNYHTESNS